MTPTNFFAMSDVVVSGNDPELADYTNPRGFIHAFAGYVVAEDDEGNRRRLYVGTDPVDAVTVARAEKVAAALNARLAMGKLPVAFGLWESYHAAYGSAAHDEYDLVEWERSLDE